LLQEEGGNSRGESKRDKAGGEGGRKRMDYIKNSMAYREGEEPKKKNGDFLEENTVNQKILWVQEKR